jgi:hypothetical protein
MFKNDNDNLSEKVFLILDKLFSDIDMFCPDENLREDGDLSETELREAAIRAKNELLEYSGSS